MSGTNTTSPLRQRMLEDMAARKLNPHTQRSHVYSCKRFAAWLKRSPDTATPDEVRRFQLYLIESGASICNRNRIMTGVRFLFRVTLRRHDLAAEVWHIKEPQKLPPVLSPEEVKRVLTMAPSLKARAMLTLAYGCGLRASEVVRLRAGDIDSEQMIIRIVQSKGRKDRHVMLPAEVLDLLRQWWKARPTKEDAGVAPEQRWLFPGRSDHQPLTTRQFSRLFKEAAKAAGLRKTTTPTSPSAARTIASTAPAAGRRCGFTRTSSSGASYCTCCPRLVMSQTFCERCGFPVPMRWLHAGGDLARPNHIHQCVDRPLMRSKRPPKCLLHSPDLRHVQTCRWRRARLPPTIELGTDT